jgi:hypothetical protein
MGIVEGLERGLPLLHQAHQGRSGRIASAEDEEDVAGGSAGRVHAELDAARQRIPVLKRQQSEVQRELKEPEPRLFFAPKLPACVLLSIVGQLGKRTSERAACVNREWQGSAPTAKGLGTDNVKL